MKTKSRYKPKKLKFSGEESFMVPKEGQKFLLAVGADVIAVDKQNAENVDVAPLNPTSVKNPNEVTTQVASPSVVIPVPDWNSMDCPTIQAEVNHLEEMLTYSRFTPEIQSQYQSIIQSGKDTLASKCGGGQTPPDVVPPAPPVITEPSWSSLSCDSVVSEIKALQTELEKGEIKLGKENYDNIQTFIKNGKNHYDKNCLKATSTDTNVGAPPITTITTTGTPIIATASTGGLGGAIGGVRGGGGAGGGGATEPKKEMNWWWLVAIASGLYLLTRKK